MRQYINDAPRLRVCTCSHNKKQHYASVKTPQAPCTLCDCKVFTVEPICPRCNHGKSRHNLVKGGCRNGCKCVWQEVAA